MSEMSHNSSKPIFQKRQHRRSKSLLVSIQGSNAALPHHVDELRLQQIFSEFDSQITEIKIIHMYSHTTLQRVGRVTFKSAPGAASALQALRGYKLSVNCFISLQYWMEKDDLEVPIQMPKLLSGAASEDCEDGRGGDRDSRTLYVKIHDSQCPNAPSITSKELRLHFQQEDLQSANVIFDHITRLPRGYGFVTFRTKTAAARAIERFQGTKLNGRNVLHLSFKRKKGETKSGFQPKTPMPPNLSDTRRKQSLSKSGFHQKQSSVSDDHIIEFKDEVIRLMLMEPGAFLTNLKDVAIKEGVELCPLPSPQYGFLMKGDPRGCKIVKGCFESNRLATERNKVGYSQIVLGTQYNQICSTNEILKCRESLKRSLRVVTACSFESESHVQACLQVSKNHVVFINIVVGSLNTEKTDAIVIPTGRAAESSNSYPIELLSLATIGDFKSLNSIKELVEIGQTASLGGGKLPCSYIIQTLFPLREQKSTDNISCDTAIENSLAHASQMHLGSIAFPGIKPQMVKSVVDGLSSVNSTTLHTVCIVLETLLAARKYEEALQDLISGSSSAGVKTVSDATPTTTPTTTPGLVHVWSWRQDDGSFTPYTSVDMKSLNESYKSDHNGACFLNIKGRVYAVYFTAMKQVNCTTHNERDVIKSSSDGTGVTWKYVDDYSRFMAYSPKDSAQIESMFQQKDTSRHLVILQRIYHFDFTRMKQINLKTGYDRDIKRIVPGDEGVKCEIVGSCTATALQRKPVFLCHKEVVINIKGPFGSLQKATSQLDKALKALLFSKVTPFPANSTAALRLKLQAIASEHGISCTIEDSNEAGASKCVLKLEGLETLVQRALTEIQSSIIEFQVSCEQLPRSAENISKYPHEWKHMSEDEQQKIVNLPASSPDYRRVSSKFQETMPNVCILKIQRVQNKWLWDRYMHAKSRVHNKNAGQTNERELFHGTRNTPSTKICASEEGFDMRFSREGMWGQANYFAVKAHYSDNYAHHVKENTTNEIILAKVLTGESYSCGPDQSLRLPPVKKQHGGGGQLEQVRYDSVNGNTHGSQVYMTYTNELAYPAYIITYSTIMPSPSSGAGLYHVTQQVTRPSPASQLPAYVRAPQLSPPSSKSNASSNYGTQPTSQPSAQAKSKSSCNIS